MEKELARFTVRIFSTENGSWQGEVLAGDKSFRFQSELQLLRWVRANYPELTPNVSWKTEGNPKT